MADSAFARIEPRRAGEAASGAWWKVVLSAAVSMSVLAVEPIVPLPQAHAHNDYEHARPLEDALDCGFCSVEADVHLVDGALLVAHDRDQVRSERTLQALYLDPLLKRVREHGGRVFRKGPPFFLMIDFKSNGPATWEALRPVLRDYAEMLTVFRDEATERKAVTIVLSGNSPRQVLAGEPVRLAAIDGRLPDLETDPSTGLVPWISDNWTRHFKWRGQGQFSEEERKRLRVLVNRAHRQGRQIRLWGTPDVEPSWRELYEAGVDFINTDKLEALRAFLLSR